MPVELKERRSWKAPPKPTEQPRKHMLDDAISENSYPKIRYNGLHLSEYQKTRLSAKRVFGTNSVISGFSPKQDEGRPSS
jgi:hypothetical protein